MLEVKNLTKYYKNVLGVENLSLKLKEGEIFGFIGPNGAGKSTTIRSIMQLINSSGDITIKGLDINKPNFKENVGYLPSEIHLYEDLTVKQMFNYANSFYKKDCKKRIKELVKIFEINENKKIDELSLGNSKKVGIVLALMHSPKLLILDEATSGLDPLMQDKFYNLLEDEKSKGTTIFFSSHNLSELKRISDRVGIIKNGKLLEINTVEELTKNNFLNITIMTKEKLSFENIIYQDKEKIKFIYKDDINTLIKVLNGKKIDKLLIEEPSIEELFMHYYKED